jgi:hypothetical protein
MINKPNKPAESIQAELPLGDGARRIEAGLQQLAAAAMTEDWMEKIRARDGERTISANELTSLTALISYVAHNAGASEFRVERDLADRFNIANAKCLPASCYDDAIRYLVDRVPPRAG